VFVLWQEGISEEGMTGISMFVCTDDMEPEDVGADLLH